MSQRYFCPAKYYLQVMNKNLKQFYFSLVEAAPENTTDDCLEMISSADDAGDNENVIRLEKKTR